MKMNFQVILYRVNRNPKPRFKNRNNAGWKHISLNEYLNISLARREEQYFFSLFHQSHRNS
ncbi:MAG TPA: hypothetical protein PLY34_02730 [Ferruginibacter sp.]|nr:hypothetical protein [Ferruginibacter sp.]HPH91909.1 hypothetical protein [Ferruginibacter sp.]